MNPSEDSAWEELKRVYEHRTEPLTAVARRHGIAMHKVYKRASREGWVPDPTVRRVPPRRMTEAAASPQQNSSPLDGSQEIAVIIAGTGNVRSALLARFYAAIEKKLSMIEEEIAAGAEVGPADRLNQTRDLNVLLNSFGKTVEIDDRVGVPDLQTGKTDEFGFRERDPERIRQELARRIARLREQGGAAGAA